MITVPPPSPRYDHANEAAFRRSLEQALSRLQSQAGGGGTAGTGTAGTIPIWGASNTLGNSSMTEAGGVVNFGARPTVGAESLAYVSQLFTQAMADARYKPIGYVPAWSEITGTPTTVAGYGITDALSIPSGDARYLQLTGGTLTGALNGTSAAFSGDVDANDFVLVGGSGGGSGGAALIDVYDEGTLLTNSLASLNFVGAGVVATNVGGAVTVNITGAVTSVFGRTGAVTAQANDYTFAQLASKPNTIAGYGIVDFNSLGDARWLQLAGGTLSGLLTANAGIIATGPAWTTSGWARGYALGNGVAIDFGYGGGAYARWGLGDSGGILYLFRTTDDSTGVGPSYWMTFDASTGININASMIFNSSPIVVNGGGYYARRADGANVLAMGYESGTNDLATVMGGGIWRIRDTGSGVPMSLTSGGVLDVLNRIRLAGVDLAEYTASYNILYRRDGGIAMYLGGADPANYYDNSAHIFRDRAGTNLVVINSSGATATDFILS